MRKCRKSGLSPFDRLRAGQARQDTKGGGKAINIFSLTWTFEAYLVVINTSFYHDQVGLIGMIS